MYLPTHHFYYALIIMWKKNGVDLLNTWCILIQYFIRILDIVF